MNIMTAAKIAGYKRMTPAERESHNDATLIGFIVRCRVSRMQAIDAIEYRMFALSRERKDRAIKWCEENLSAN